VARGFAPFLFIRERAALFAISRSYRTVMCFVYSTQYSTGTSGGTKVNRVRYRTVRTCSDYSVLYCTVSCRQREQQHSNDDCSLICCTCTVLYGKQYGNRSEHVSHPCVPSKGRTVQYDTVQYTAYSRKRFLD